MNNANYDFCNEENTVLYYYISDKEKRETTKRMYLSTLKFVWLVATWGPTMAIATVVAFFPLTVRITLAILKKAIPGIVTAAFIITTFNLFAPAAYCTGISMAPSYTTQIVGVDRTFTPEDITRGTVVRTGLISTGEHRYRKLHKRVVAVPGDTVCIRDGFLYINKQLTTDQYPWMHYGAMPCQYDEITLAEDEYFLLGDNRNNSTDSRYFGPVKFDKITAIITTPAREITPENSQGVSSQEFLEIMYEQNLANGNGDAFLEAIATYE